MTDKQFQSAKDLESSLTRGEVCHDPVIQPLVEMSEAVTRAASTAERLDDAVAAKQREHLLHMAQQQTAAPAPTPASPQKPATASRRWFQRPWIVIPSGAALVAAAVMVAVVTRHPLPTISPANVTQISQLVIPEAHAADAFSVLAQKQDATGADIATAFVVTSTEDLPVDVLRQHLKIVPALTNDGSAPSPIVITIDRVQDRQYVVTPSAPLDAAKVYKVQIDAKIKAADGSESARDFSWAFQTKNTFRVTSSVPGPNASGVPVNTGIEFTMSMPDWEDPSTQFTISPHVDGKFETHGRDMTFVPSKPLAYATIYTVTLSKGWKVKGGDAALQKDVVMSFETQSLDAATAAGSQKPYISVSEGMFLRTSPGRATRFAIWTNTDLVKNVQMTGFALSRESALKLLQDQMKIPYFAALTQQAEKTFQPYLTNKVFDAVVPVETENYMSFLSTPKSLDAGWYVLKLQPKDGDAVFVVYESTNLATYLTGDASKMLVWAMNVETNRPIEGAEVTTPSSTAKTDVQGLATIATPDVLTSTSTTDGIVLDVRQGNLESMIPMQQNRGLYNGYFGGWYNGDKETISYVYADRPLYHTTDSMQVFAFAQDRASGQPASNLTLQLVQSSLMDWYRDDNAAGGKVYRQVTLQPDAAGVSRGTLDWSLLEPGWYSVRLMRGDHVVNTRSFEIRDFVKPAYTISVSAPNAVYAGDVISADVQAQFFNGTPMPKLKLHVDEYVDGVAAASRDIVTDENGHVSISLPTEKEPCLTMTTSTSLCQMSHSVNINVGPVGGEETNIQSSAYVTVYRTHANVDIVAKRDPDSSKVVADVVVKNVDLSKSESWYLGEPMRNVAVTGRILKHAWVGTQTGTYYDPINKVTSPTYTYSEVVSDAGSFSATTDVSGTAHATLDVPSDQKDVWYQAVASVADGQGNVSYGSSYIYMSWYGANYPSDDTSIQLNVIDPVNKSSYAVGEKVTLGFVQKKNVIKKPDTPSILYVTSHLGITSSVVTSEPTHDVSLSAQDLPNVRVTGVMFENGGFIDRFQDVGFDTSVRELKVELSADQTSYAPGGVAKIHVKAMQADGKPAAGARTVVGSVDEALYAAAGYGGSAESPVGSLFSWVDDGIIFHQATLAPKGLEASAFGGAERGGGGGGGDAAQVRKNFKDTASFDIISLNDSGEGDVTIHLPDNLTSWRITGVTVAPQLYGGTNQININVTKPVFVDAVIPSPMLIADKPMIKLRAYGSALSAGTPVTLSVDAPTLGLKNEQVQAKVGEAAYVTVDALPAGDHVLTIRVTSDKGSDAMEKHLVVLTSRFTHTERVTTDLGPGSKLPDPGASREVTVQFLPRNRAQYLDEVWSVATTWSTRVEAQIAKRIAQNLLITQFGEKNVTVDDGSLAKYQQYDGGIGLLSYASADPEVTAKLAMIAPQSFDQGRLTDYLHRIVTDTSMNREQAIRGYAGLAALGNPVLIDLQALARQPDLNWHEQLAVMRGLISAGDQEGARVVLAQLLTKADEKDGKISLRVADDRKSITEATAEAAAIATDLADPSATKLYAWVAENWSDEALTVLDKAEVLSHVVPRTPSQDVSVAYMLNGTSSTIALTDSWGQSLKLTADEMKSFQVLSVTGPAVAVVDHDVAGIPTSGKDVAVTRTYEDEHGNAIKDLHEGDLVTVKLALSVMPGAQSGCYIVRDHVPAGFLAQVRGISSFWTGYWWPEESSEDGVVTFTACPTIPAKDPEPPTILSYTARVIARGTYLAEPAIAQSIESPSVQSVSGSTSIEIK